MLAFQCKRQEQAWSLHFARDNAGLDAAISLQTVFFPSLVARMLWDHHNSSDGSRLGKAEALWLAAFLAWTPLLLWLSQRRAATYLRLRTPLVLLSRVHRLLTIVRWAALFDADATASADGQPWPTAQEGALGMLLWRPGSLITLLLTYMLPLKYTAPCAAAFLLATLHTTVRHCTAECRDGRQVAAARFYGGLVRSAWGWLRDGTAFDAASSCTGLCSADACRRSCVAVHAGLQTAVGTLLPLAVIWAIEERSRLRFQRAWLQQYVLEEAGDAGAGSSFGSRDNGSGAADAAQLREGSLAEGDAALATRLLPGEQVTHRPVPLFVLAAWFVAASSVVWAVLLGLVS